MCATRLVGIVVALVLMFTVWATADTQAQGPAPLAIKLVVAPGRPLRVAPGTTVRIHRIGAPIQRAP